jgi:hypothetical protein
MPAGAIPLSLLPEPALSEMPAAGDAGMASEERRISSGSAVLSDNFHTAGGMRKFGYRNQKAVYGSLLRASAVAMQRLARDERFPGGQIGILSILHTWKRDLGYQPHVHCLVPAVGGDEEGCAVYPKRKGFLFPVRALSRLFRGEIRKGLSKELLKGDIPQGIWKDEWVVHCKPVGSGKRTLTKIRAVERPNIAR